MSLSLYCPLSLLVLLFSVAPISSECPHEAADLKPWSDSASWGSGAVPASGEDVVITTPILLDTITEELSSVRIQKGGRLVFKPSETLVKLTSDFILVEEEGSFIIGSSDCHFEASAEILLTGNMGDKEDIPEFGQKFLGVMANGTIEIHGEERLTWTKLTASAGPSPKIFTSLHYPTNNVGLTLYEFNPADGSFIEAHSLLPRDISGRPFNPTLTADDSILVLANRHYGSEVLFKKKKFFYKFMKNLETSLGLPSGGLSTLRESWKDYEDSWIMIVNRATSEVTIHVDNYEPGASKTETDELQVEVNGLLYKAKNTDNKKILEESRVMVEVLDPANPHSGFETIEVEKDVSSWRKGEQVVIASTDFDWQQAEVLVIEEVNGNSIKLKGELNYQHYGEVYKGVDMRAEVGLLTRNILIHGAVDNEVDDYNFGGHTKALRGFKAYNIEGAEFTHMGQSTILGSYPIHYHMCHDTDEVTNPIVKGNGIHHCFSRCVTVHGSHGVHVINNVAYDTRGHCYFLEDGGEKRTLFDGNLGLGTRRGRLTGSDSQPSTFWITSPETIMTNNAAAGSDSTKGVGIWYIYPNRVVGPSSGLGFIDEPKKMANWLFNNNVAHSNGQHGLALLRRLGGNHSIQPCFLYAPETPATFSNFTGYKNRDSNAIFRSTKLIVNGLRVADSKRGIVIDQKRYKAKSLVSDSIVLGATPNKGAGGQVEVFEGGKWKLTWSDRSYPSTRVNNNAEEYRGVLFGAGGNEIKNVVFDDFSPKDLVKQEQCNIGFRELAQKMDCYSPIEGISFADGARRICGETGKETSPMPANMRDVDGSITGIPGSSLVSRNNNLSPRCEVNDFWNIAVCPPDLSLQRLEFELTGKNASIALVRESDGFTVSRGFFGPFVDDNYFVHWPRNSPIKADVTLEGLEKGDVARIGICLPLSVAAAEAEMPGKIFRFSDKKRKIIMASSLEDLDNPDTENNVFYDGSSGIVYVRVAETRERTYILPTSCPGGCPKFKIDLTSVDGLDVTDGDCRNRM